MTAPLPPPESARLMALYSAATAAAEWTRIAGLTGSPEAEKAALAFVRAAAAGPCLGGARPMQPNPR